MVDSCIGKNVQTETAGFLAPRIEEIVRSLACIPTPCSGCSKGARVRHKVLRFGRPRACGYGYNESRYFVWVIIMANDPDFETLKHLSETEPQAYFAERARLIEAFFESVPTERRDSLRSFQAQIDAVRASAGTPGKAVENLMGMLSDHLGALLGYTAQMAQEAQQLRAVTRPQH